MSYGVEKEVEAIIERYLDQWSAYHEQNLDTPWTEYDPIKAMARDIRFEILLLLDDVFEKAWQYDDLCD